MRTYYPAQRWASWSAIPRPCSAMALPWPSGKVGNCSKNPARTRRERPASAGQVVPAPARPWRRIGALWGDGAGFLHGEEDNHRTAALARPAALHPCLPPAGTHSATPCLGRQVLLRRGSGEGGTGCHLEQPDCLHRQKLVFDIFCCSQFSQSKFWTIHKQILNLLIGTAFP
jgi:hypothetical protein